MDGNRLPWHRPDLIPIRHGDLGTSKLVAFDDVYDSPETERL
jgi:hypothetical protein